MRTALFPGWTVIEIIKQQPYSMVALFCAVLALGSVTPGDSAAAQQGAPPRPLKKLSKMYLCVHALSWMHIVPGDPRRQTKIWEIWPGRCDTCYAYEQRLREKYYQIFREADADTGMLLLPNGMENNTEPDTLAKEYFGDRCAILPTEAIPAANREAFQKGLEADRQRALLVRGGKLDNSTQTVGCSDGELGAWERAKNWAFQLRAQLEKQGYTFDPATVRFIALGEDWSGCAATYPILMGRALGLAHPMERRFDLMNPDCSVLMLKVTPVEQNLPMPHDIRLFVFKTPEGRFVAQYWEGMHGLVDRPHVITVDFPPGSVRVLDYRYGVPQGEQRYGKVRMSVGCGAHTPYASDLVQAEPGLSLEQFRKALLAGKVSEVQ